jgi:hypothetical protein
MKQLTQFLATAVIAGALSGCLKTNDDQPKTPIFAGTEEIGLILPSNDGSLASNGSFSYSVPGDVKYLVIGVFNAEIATSGKTITNTSNFVAGSRDGMTDFVRGSQSRTTLHSFNQTTRDFDSALFNPTGTGHYWAVWGYDQFGNLTHSSPQRRVNFP